MTVGITELPPEGMQLGGVALAGDADRGTKTTEGLSLLFTTAGITVQGPQPQIERLLVWSVLDSATCQEKLVLPDGRHAAIMELTSGGQSIRFLLPTDTVSPGQAAYLDQALPAWLSRYKGVGVPVGVAASTAASGRAAEAADPQMARTEATGQASAPPPPAPPPPPPPPAPDGSRIAPTAATAAEAAAADTAARAANGHGSGSAPAPNGTASGSAEPGPIGERRGQATTAPPPPPPPPLAGSTGPGQGGSADPEPDPEAPRSPWDGLPTDDVSSFDVQPPAQAEKPKKSRRSLTRRKAKPEQDAASAAGAAPFFGTAEAGGHRPPDAPPENPVPLGLELPPPPVDPFAGFPDETAVVPLETEQPKTKQKVRSRRGRRAKAADAGVAAGAGLAADAGPAAGDGVAAEAGLATAATAAGAAAVAAGAVETPAPPDAPPPPTGRTDQGPTTAPGLFAGDGPVSGEIPVAPETWDDAPSEGATSGLSRSTVMVLVVALLVVVLGGVGYVLTRKTSPTTTPTTSAGVTSPAAADVALAASVNLRLGDLPAGWTRSTTPAVTRMQGAPPVAQVTAEATLATCLGTNVATVTGLFANGSVPGQTAVVDSPNFQSAAGPSFEMSSRTGTAASASEIRGLDGVLSSSRFVPCFGQYQSALAAAAIPGSTAQIQPVTLGGPSGVTSFGVVTTVASPSQGTEVVGDAFILGGRVLTVLQPVTSGAAIPPSVFTPAYDAVAGRVAATTR